MPCLISCIFLSFSFVRMAACNTCHGTQRDTWDSAMLSAMGAALQHGTAQFELNASAELPVSSGSCLEQHQNYLHGANAAYDAEAHDPMQRAGCARVAGHGIACWLRCCARRRHRCRQAPQLRQQRAANQ